jgi:TRAP transporter TAXI family solute receptor
MSSSTTPRRATVRLAAGGAAAALLLSACGNDGGGNGADAGQGGSKPQGGALTIATGGTGGVYYPLGGGIATVVRENVEGYDATVQETNASVDNMRLIDGKGADIALAVGDVVSDAVEGEGDFKDKPLEICSLGNLYNNFMQPVTTKDSGVTNVESMKGKSISVGAPGSATEVLALRILEQAGLDPDKDIKRQQLGASETVDALRDGTIAAGFWSGGVPTGALVEFASTGKMALVPIGEYAAPLAEKFGDYYVEKEVPAGSYEGQDQAVSLIASPNILVARKDMDKQLQHDITAAIFDNKEQLVSVHPSAKELDAKTAGDVAFVDACEGAKEYFDKAGS